MKSLDQLRSRRWCFRLLLVAGLALFLAGCATTRPPDPTGPSAEEDPYPVYLNEDKARREASLAAWKKLVTGQTAAQAPEPELLPVTATIRSLPTTSSDRISLPPVGRKLPPTEEELRESLRRFLSAAGPLVCEDGRQLTLVQRADNADGSRSAFYEQRPFRYRLRGDFGRVRVDFTSDRRVAQLTSSCLPDLDEDRRDIQSLRPADTVTPEKIAALLIGHTFAPPAGSAAGGALTVAGNSDYIIAELVILVRETAAAPNSLEFRLAWEVMLNAGFAVYVDAIDGTLLTTPAA